MRRLSEVPGLIKTEEITKEDIARCPLFVYIWRDKMIECVFIRKEYFEERSFFVKMLDSGNLDKQQHRKTEFPKNRSFGSQV